MVFALASALLLSVSKGDIWLTEDNRAIAWCSNGYASTWSGDNYLSIGPLTQVPDGSYIGSWAMSKTLSVAQSSGNMPGDGDFSVRDSTGMTTAYSAESAGVFPCVVWHPEIPSSFGEYHLKMFSATGLSVSLIDERKRPVETIRAYKVASFDDISVNGDYSTDNVTAHIEDPGSARTDIGGWLKFAGEDFLMKGARLATRARFNLISRSEGTVRGYGYFEWRPTAKQQRDIGLGKNAPADQVILWLFMLNGSTSRTGMTKTMVRK